MRRDAVQGEHRQFTVEWPPVWMSGSIGGRSTRSRFTIETGALGLGRLVIERKNICEKKNDRAGRTTEMMTAIRRVSAGLSELNSEFETYSELIVNLSI